MTPDQREKEQSVAALQPACQPAPEVLGERTTETETRTGKLGPDDVTKTKVTEPALAPAATPASESRGGSSKGLGGILATLGGWLVCAVTLGGVCAP